MKTWLLAAVLALVPFPTFGQATGADPDARLSTRPGHDIAIGIGRYDYTEPGGLAIAIHGAKIVGDYTGTLPLNSRRRWFGQANVRGTIGNVSYDGWCSPFLIAPNSRSSNGYELGLGDASSCSEAGDKDWYVEGRALVGKDFIGEAWGLSPSTGVGLRHLSNGTTGVNGYRTDDYLYVPLALTARTTMASRRALSVTLEYDRLIHGWQKTRDSRLGGGDVPATPTAPAFTIDDFSDIAFSQSSGWALRTSASVHVTTRLSLEPYYIRWSVNASPVNDATATFTVNHATARQLFGAYEPYNVTSEWGVRLGFR